MPANCSNLAATSQLPDVRSGGDSGDHTRKGPVLPGTVARPTFATHRPPGESEGF